jgi:hypothetical protein
MGHPACRIVLILALRKQKQIFRSAYPTAWAPSCSAQDDRALFEGVGSYPCAMRLRKDGAPGMQDRADSCFAKDRSRSFAPLTPLRGAKLLRSGRQVAFGAPGLGW